MQSPPSPHEYIDLLPLALGDWSEGLDQGWIEGLNDPDDADNYWHWPIEWRDAYDNAKKTAAKAVKAQITETFKCGRTTLYYAEKQGQWYAETASWDHGQLARVIPDRDRFDEAAEAVDSFIRAYKRWDRDWGKKYHGLGYIPFTSEKTDPVICDLCGTTFHAPTDSEIEVCPACQ